MVTIRLRKPKLENGREEKRYMSADIRFRNCMIYIEDMISDHQTDGKYHNRLKKARVSG